MILEYKCSIVPLREGDGIYCIALVYLWQTWHFALLFCFLSLFIFGSDPLQILVWKIHAKHQNCYKIHQKAAYSLNDLYLLSIQLNSSSSGSNSSSSRSFIISFAFTVMLNSFTTAYRLPVQNGKCIISLTNYSQSVI